MEEYTEKQVLEQVGKDLSGGVFSPESIYMRKDLLTKDTGRSLEDITASCLLAHSEILKDGSLLALPGTTTVKSKSASGGANRNVDQIIRQGYFYHKHVIGREITISFPEERKETFAFAAADDDGKMASLFYMMPAPGKEGMLAGILNVHAMLLAVRKKGVHELIPEIPSDAGISAVILLHAGAGDASRECRMLAIKLGISILRLYHGIYAVPISSSLAIEGQYTKDGLLSMIEKDSNEPWSLFQKEYINHGGVTADTGEPCVKVLSEWLFARREIWLTVPQGRYRLLEGSRMEYESKSNALQMIRRQKVLPPFGEVLSSGIVFLGTRVQQVGCPSLLLETKLNSPKGSCHLIRALETADPSDMLLRCVLRAFTHILSVDTGKLVRDLHLEGSAVLEAKILVPKGSSQEDLFLRDLPYVEQLMNGMGVGLAFLEEGYQAVL